MRMWNVNPKRMCRQHLLGEHVEMHMFSSCLKKGMNLQGYLEKGLVETHNVKKRHDELAKEMKRRGYNHKSNIGSIGRKICGKVSVRKNENELKIRCKECFR